MAKNNKPKESTLQEFCGKCGSKAFNIAKDAGLKRYCSSCNNVWAPMSEDQLHVAAVLADNAKLKDENKALKERLKAFEGDPVPPDVFN